MNRRKEVRFFSQQKPLLLKDEGVKFKPGSREMNRRKEVRFFSQQKRV